jgi:hypothetical protein
VRDVSVGVRYAKCNQLGVQRQSKGYPVVKKAARPQMAIQMVVVIGYEDERAINIVIGPADLIQQQETEILRFDFSVGPAGEIAPFQGPNC